MKIAIVNKHKQDTLGGSEVQSDIIAGKLTDFGHEVIYIAVKGGGNYQTRYRVIPVESSFGAILEAVDQCKPDIVYWRYNKHHLYPVMKGISRRGIPVVFAVSHIQDLKKWGAKAVSREKSFLKRAVITLIRAVESRKQYRGMDFVDGVVVNNREFLKRSGHPRTTFIRSSVEPEITPFSYDKPYYIWISSLKPSKRPELCLRLAKEISELDADILMVGDIVKESYDYFNEDRTLPNNVKYLGKKPIEEVNGIIKESLALLHTGEPEGFANTFMQSWMSGKPVISYEYNPDSLLTGNQLGTCSAGNFEDFVAQVKKLKIDPDHRNQLAGNTRKFAKEEFSPDKNVHLLEQYFEETLDKQGGK